MAASTNETTAPSGAEAPDVFHFDNTYARLPDRFFVRQAPVPVKAPSLVHLNTVLAAELGLDAEHLASPRGVAVLAGNRVPSGAEPLAQAYAGHQFGGFSPSLGDGRALLLGEITDRSGQRCDIQLKGSGPTPFSRRGDGRAALGPMLRELIIGEALFAHGIPTTRALAVVTTGEYAMREKPLVGAVLTRVAASHIRVGTFQFFAARRDTEAVRTLADYVIARHYPHCTEAANPYLALLEEVTARQAELVARWQLIGFIHGVMNTDNMAISGQSIDFGPCAFMDAYHPGTVYSSVDETGRYAYANQPGIAQWNLTRLAECLLELIDTDEGRAVDQARTVLMGFGPRFEAAHLSGLRRKLGLQDARDGDATLAGDLLELMAAAGADYTLTFRSLADVAGPDDDASPFVAHFADRTAATDWLARWRGRLAEEPVASTAARHDAMRLANPLYIPRNHLVEEALSQAQNAGDLGPLGRLLDILSRPFDHQPGAERHAQPPRPDEVVHLTFCGT
ncbi:MAG: YdiU family protein [Hyphomicrobiaceae bacterium]|nr:YdiU family protein [Hyphomicrobiaceae bacterium]